MWTLCKVPSWESTLLICILILDDINLPMGFLAVFSFFFFNIIIIPFAAVLVELEREPPFADRPEDTPTSLVPP